MRSLLLIIALVAAGCRTYPTESTVTSASTTSELDVVVSFLADHYDYCMKSNTPLVVEDTFSIAMLHMSDESHEELTRSPLSQASDEVPADLIRDFCDKNAKPHKVWPELRERRPVILLSKADLETLFSAGHDQKPDAWDRFYTKYPKSPGVITLSRVGFNRRRGMAMVYVGSQSHWLAGGGHIRILHKQVEKWVVVPGIIGPMWVS